MMLPLALTALLVSCCFLVTHTQHANDNLIIPQVIRPIKDVRKHPNISVVLQRMGFVTLHVPEGYYPNAFFVFIHIPKAGGTTFNVRSCPVLAQGCGPSCGCGNCGMPYYHSGQGSYPKLQELMSGTCPMFSFEMNYPGFKYAFEHPVPQSGRPLYMLTMIRKPYNFIRSQIAHFLAMHHHKYKQGDRSAHTLQCLDARQHFNASSKCTVYNLNNGQTDWLASGDTELAISIMQKFFALGITEYHEESMCLFQYQLGQFNPSRCNLKYISKVKSESSAKIWSSGKSYHQFEHEPGMQDLLAQNTRQDEVLWTAAMELFAQRIQYVENVTNVRLVDPTDFLFQNFLPSDV